MLGLKYVVAKSKELQTKLERGAGVASGSSSSSNAGASPSSRYSARSALNANATGSNANAESSSAAAASVENEDESSATAAAALRQRGVSSPTSGRNEGDQFLTLQQKQWEKALAKHDELLVSGEKLGDALGVARKKLQDQVESEQFIQQNFHQISKVREQIARMRGLVAKIAEDIEDVEQFLIQKTEEYMAAQNASFASRQQEEIELFELRILDEKEDLKRQLLEERRQQLARAFQNDIKTYQTLVTYQGESLPKTVVADEAYTAETLESVDLVVTADADQLNAFYESASEEEESDLEVESLDTEPSLLASEAQENSDKPDESSDVGAAPAPPSHVESEQTKSVEVIDLGGEEEEEKEGDGGDGESSAAVQEEAVSAEEAVETASSPAI